MHHSTLGLGVIKEKKKVQILVVSAIRWRFGGCRARGAAGGRDTTRDKIRDKTRVVGWGSYLRLIDLCSTQL